MKMKQSCLLLVFVTLLVVPSFLQAAQTCDRQCLVDLMKDYLAALVAHDPSAVPFDRYVKYTQNTAEIPVGYGLWETASGGPSEFQIYAADPVNQQVVALVMMKENRNQDILLGVRLALRRGKISEAEHHVVKRNEINIQNLQKPRPGLVEDIAPEDKTPRDQMLDIGLSYYDALTGEDGKLAPFAQECQRRENGGISVGGKKEDFPEPKEAPRDFAPPETIDPEMMKLAKALSLVPNTCEGQITAGVWGYISEIRNRRLLVIDEQKGLAVGFSNLCHDSKLKTMKLYGIPGVDSVPAYQGTFNMPAIHFFKIKKGKIYDIEATGLVLPYGTKTGWE
ncbi:MAG: hypothetical protein JW882_06895 [Deltaproteobacteria bacterium]|nr:hypothetical protein [Deltaproteobacteria bacterium]